MEGDGGLHVYSCVSEGGFECYAIFFITFLYSRQFFICTQM